MGFADVVAEKFKPVCLPKESLEYLNKPRALEAANSFCMGCVTAVMTYLSDVVMSSSLKLTLEG